MYSGCFAELNRAKPIGCHSRDAAYRIPSCHARNMIKNGAPTSNEEIITLFTLLSSVQA